MSRRFTSTQRHAFKRKAVNLHLFAPNLTMAQIGKRLGVSATYTSKLLSEYYQERRDAA